MTESEDFMFVFGGEDHASAGPGTWLPTQPAGPSANSQASAPTTQQGWPVPMAPAAYHGIVGRVVQAIELHTEADPHAVLLQTLVGFGNLLGRDARFAVEADEHSAALE